MNVRVLSEARLELFEAVAHYEAIHAGLGRRLWWEVEEHIAWIGAHAEVPSLRPGGYRRVNLRIFPYYLPYIVRGDALWVLAVAHVHRRPEYWIERTTGGNPE